MKITVYTRKGEIHRYINVDNCKVFNEGLGLLKIEHDDRYIEYYGLGSVDRWTIEMGAKDE